ncbi:unnamed protein product [Rotaria sp. Silwood1]|nr:unnamed protein product [Rotaria sp. Silwood1]
MRSSIVFMLFLALLIMVFMTASNARQIQIEDDDDDDFQISNARARAFLGVADDYAKRANGDDAGKCKFGEQTKMTRSYYDELMHNCAQMVDSVPLMTTTNIGTYGA